MDEASEVHSSGCSTSPTLAQPWMPPSTCARCISAQLSEREGLMKRIQGSRHLDDVIVADGGEEVSSLFRAGANLAGDEERSTLLGYGLLHLLHKALVGCHGAVFGLEDRHIDAACSGQRSEDPSTSAWAPVLSHTCTHAQQRLFRTRNSELWCSWTNIRKQAGAKRSHA